MTNEEAITVLTDMCVDFNLHPNSIQHEAMLFAINSLKNDGWNPLESNEEGMIIGSLPEEGEEVLVTVYGRVEIDSFGCDFICEDYGEEGQCAWFCENNDIEDVKAWMPKPAPYKGEIKHE